MSKTFTHQSFLPATVEALTEFHKDPQAFQRLTMPPLIFQVLRDDRTSLTSGEIEFRLWFGLYPVRWLARHVPGPIPTSFKDVQISGPMGLWEHEHIFEAAPGGAKLTDHITLKHKPGVTGWLTRFLFDGLSLRILFAYRHWQTRRFLKRQSNAQLTTRPQ